MTNNAFSNVWNGLNLKNDTQRQLETQCQSARLILRCYSLKMIQFNKVKHFKLFLKYSSLKTEKIKHFYGFRIFVNARE